MILQIDDWKFDIDMTATMEYSANEAESHCDCAYCRNFYAALDGEYPNFRKFLADFGLDAEAPGELMPFDEESGMLYLGEYVVSGRILQIGNQSLCVDGVYITPEYDSEINHTMLKPCFYLTLEGLHLPWVLDEPMKDVLSPANLPSFLKRMWKKLMSRQPKSDITS